MACAKYFLAVGLIHSPITLVGSSSVIIKVFVTLANFVNCFSSLTIGLRFLTLSLITLICSGVVPQQPPIIFAPALIKSST